MHTNVCLSKKYKICFGIVFAHADVTPPVGPPYWITASGLYQLLPCKLAKFSSLFMNPQNGSLFWDFDYLLETFSCLYFQ